MNPLALRALKPLIVILFVGSVLVQALIPLVSWTIWTDQPDPTAAVIYGIAGFLAVVCAQVALVAMWKLLTLVQRDDIFSPLSFRWVDLIIRVGWIATGLCLIVAMHDLLIANIGPLTVPMALMGCVVAALSVTMLVLVLRQLLTSAMNYKAELSEVV